MNKEKLKKMVEEIILEFVDDGELEVNENYEIEYTQEWLNEWLMDWIKDGYSTREVIYILECFENFEAEKDVEVWESVSYEIYPGHSDTYEINEHIETTIINTKKVA